jgi:hypothetical protein
MHREILILFNIAGNLFASLFLYVCVCVCVCVCDTERENLSNLPLKYFLIFFTLYCAKFEAHVAYLCC